MAFRGTIAPTTKARLLRTWRNSLCGAHSFQQVPQPGCPQGPFSGLFETGGAQLVLLVLNMSISVLTYWAVSALRTWRPLGDTVPTQWLQYQACCSSTCRVKLLLAPAHGEERPPRVGLGCLFSLCSSRERQCLMCPRLSHRRPSWLWLLCSGRRGCVDSPEGLLPPSFVLPALRQHWAPAGWGWEAASRSDLLCPSATSHALHSEVGMLGLPSAVLLV